MPNKTDAVTVTSDGDVIVWSHSSLSDPGKPLGKGMKAAVKIARYAFSAIILQKSHFAAFTMGPSTLSLPQKESTLLQAEKTDSSKYLISTYVEFAYRPSMLC